MKDFREKSILLLPAMPLSEINGVTGDEQRFNSNMFIGTIRFSGCIITNTSYNNIRQSESRTYSMQSDYTATIVQSLARTLRETLSNRKYSFREYLATEGSPLPVRDIIRFEAVTDRNKYPEDGEDNINLPRIIYQPVALNEDVRKRLLNENCDYIMIPVIEYYYGHNGGWFNDQEWGCSAGLRMACQILVFDMRTGSMVLYYRNYEKNIIPFKYQISIPEISRELYVLEKEMMEKIDEAID